MANKIKGVGLIAGLAFSLFFVAGCERAAEIEQFSPGEVSFDVTSVVESDDITRSDDGVMTKTEYSNQDQTGATVNSGSRTERIDWLSTDMIKVVCQQAQGDKYANFSITPASTSGAVSNATITPADHKLYWNPNGGEHHFFGLYPSTYMNNLDGNPTGADIVPSSDGNSATITATIPATQKVTYASNTEYNELKPDMAYAYMYAAAKATSGNIHLSFKPLMNAIRFTLKSTTAFPNGLTLKKLVLSSETVNLRGKFTATITDNGLTPLQSGNISSAGKSITINVPDGVQLKTDKVLMFTFLTLPIELTDMKLTMTFSDGSTKVLNLKSGGNPITLAATKKAYINDVGLPWIYVLEVTGGFTTNYLGGSGNYSVTSYKQISGTGTKYPVAWEAYEYRTQEDGASSYGGWVSDKPVWLTTFTAGATPANGNAKSYAASLAPADRHSTAIDALTNANARGSATSPWDLSTHSITGGSISKTTANCYVVSAPGWYKFPLAYGNAYKGGSVNTNAYAPTKSTATRYLTPFIKHSGTISSPDIASVGSAELVWQDAKNLITVSDLKVENGYVVFHIEKANICEGNAVIAAKHTNGSTILWSWHIWVTPYTGNVSMRGKTYQARNLGWCDGGEITWPARNVQAHFRQPENPKWASNTKTVTFKQTKNTETVLGTGPHYQWGRKDPLIPPIGIPGLPQDETANKIWYNAAGVASQSVPLAQGPKNPQYAITHPMDMIWMDRYALPGYKDGAQYSPYTNANGGWPFSDWIGNASAYYGQGHYVNLWNYNATTADNVNAMLTVNTFKSLTHGKTVYDPCPVGYTVPLPTELSNLATTTEQMGGYANYSGSQTITWSAADSGFKCNGNILPANGMRFYLANNQHVGNVGTLGYYFSSAYCNAHNGLSLIFADPNQPDNVVGASNKVPHMTASFAKGSGRSIRCVPE